MNSEPRTSNSEFSGDSAPGAHREGMEQNLVRCGSCGNVISSELLTEDFSGACPWCMAGLSLPQGGRRPTAIEELSPRAGPLPCDDPVAELPPEAAAAPESARFGRFIRVHLLGKGGMGEVWKAWDTALGRWVALKLFHEEDPQDIARLTREAETAATLSHPHIASIYEIGNERGRPYLAMQYVEGVTLLQYPRRDRKALVRIVRDAARAVAEAHRLGIVHRDLKPANLVVAAHGEKASSPHVYVLDFGLARLTAPSGRLALSGVLDGQLEEVRAAYRPWFDFEAPGRDEGWALISAVRRPS